ncbi:stalk domain-containing protein [Paenibacillus illinoisensis]|uniref:stalk domain-containing protein n=1 Tax=Paenibacillus illinoisensis TaxID=59845 RepID=UPI003D951369
MKKTLRDIRNIATGVIAGIALTATTAVSFAGTDSISALFNRDLKFVVNGETVKSGSPAITANNSTYLQLRDVANMLDYKVGYDGKTKTITLTDQEGTGSTTSSNTANNSTSTTTSTKPANDDLTTNDYDYRKLPITLDRGNGDISFTLNSITHDDEKVYFNFSLSNPTGRKFQIMGETSASNMGLPDKKLFGAKTTGQLNDKEYEYQIAYNKSFFSKDTKNARINLKVNYYSLDMYSFKVDTTGMFDDL